MTINKNISRIFLEYISGLICSIIISLATWGIAILFVILWLEISMPLNDFFNRESFVFAILFIGFPLGSTSGIILMDKLFFKLKDWNIIGIIFSFIFSFIFAVLCFIFIIQKTDNIFYLSIILFLSVPLLCLLGFHIFSIAKKIVHQ